MAHFLLIIALTLFYPHFEACGKPACENRGKLKSILNLASARPHVPQNYGLMKAPAYFELWG